MLALKKVAITGTISSGKSTVLSHFRTWGAYTVDADSLLHAVFSSDTPVGQKILELFGEQAFVPDGTIDRAYIGKQIAHNRELRSQLEEICHPYVLKRLGQLYEEVKDRVDTWKLFVAEVPLLFESSTPFAAWFDVVCVVDASLPLLQQRFLQKGHTLEQFIWRYESQMAPEKKKQYSHYSIENNGTLEELRDKAKSLFTTLTCTPYGSYKQRRN